VRKIVFEQLNLGLHQRIEELGRTLGEELLEPTKIYIKPLLNIISEFHVHGIAHITGGGVLENIPRILPDSCQVVIHRGSWIIPPIFPYLQEKGNISDLEMLRTFNNGIGMVIIVPQEEAEDIIARLKNMHLQSYCIGEVAKQKAKSEPIVFV
jgi:phosphoribosylformylglycinamidine cyclo-ligase